jgi:pimeloyl-ACP methyl ester carboxylesterase
VTDFERETAGANGVAFSLLSAGPAAGPLALCLHGFPDTAWTWRFLLPRLAEAGYRAVAPFLRGYAPTSVPEDGRYDVGVLAEDANALHEALGGDGRAVLVGHDWGAIATYPALAAAPERWRAAVTMAAPPAPALAAGLFDYDQLKRSFYVYVFQLPFAEAIVASGDLAFATRLWQDWSPGYDATFDLARLRESLGDAANLSAALGYYRALFSASRVGGPPPDGLPLLYLHGRDDGCIGASLAESAGAEVVDGAGHFLHLEKPDEIGARIVSFLASASR